MGWPLRDPNDADDLLKALNKNMIPRSDETRIHELLEFARTADNPYMVAVQLSGKGENGYIKFIGGNATPKQLSQMVKMLLSAIIREHWKGD